MDNPYNRLINLMKQHGAAYNPPSIQLAEVVESNPLIIKIGDLQVDKDNLLIADYILKADTVKQGDVVTVMPMEDTQTYIVLCKVVSI